MADPTPTPPQPTPPAPEPQPRFPRLRRALPWIVPTAINVVFVLLLHLPPLLPVPFGPAPVPTPVPPVKQAAPEVPADPPPPARAMGWVPNPAGTRAILATGLHPDFDKTPAGKAVRGPDQDTFLWRPVLKLTGGKYPNVDQKQVGCCCGCGWKHCADVCQAVQIVTMGRPAEFKPISVEVTYAGGRKSGNMLRGGDGCFGAAMAQYVRADGGLCPMEKVGSYDLTTFDPMRARQFGRTGPPPACQAVAKDHPVKATALVKSFNDVAKAVQQGYPVAICSDVGFQGMRRDRDGFIRPSGNWPHCMAIIGVRFGSRPGAFILNSWGDQAHPGPVWPEDMPVAGFWADASAIDRITGEGDSFALSDAVGFPARQLDWFAAAPRRKPLNFEPAEFALAP